MTTLDPAKVTFTKHALERYQVRSNGRHTPVDPEAGLRLLLKKAAKQPIPPAVATSRHAVPARRYLVSGMFLVLNEGLDRLLTLYRKDEIPS